MCIVLLTVMSPPNYYFGGKRPIIIGLILNALLGIRNAMPVVDKHWALLSAQREDTFSQTTGRPDFGRSI
jgi:hypothetical protein